MEIRAFLPQIQSCRAQQKLWLMLCGVALLELPLLACICKLLLSVLAINCRRIQFGESAVFIAGPLLFSHRGRASLSITRSVTKEGKM
jgi:hypothetical protein